MKLLALVLLLSAFSSLTLTEVVNSSSSFKEHCPSFFIPNPENQNDIIIPTIFPGDQYRMICQRWNNDYRFATVYDTERRIPVYSAYTFSKEGNTKKSNEWKIEPQLENIKEYKEKREMIDSPTDEETVRNIINQAVDIDYKDSNYTRGHVFPRLFAVSQSQAESTYTLTNIAPQTEHSNGEWERQVEKKMRGEIKNSCKLDQNYPVYIVTGVVPGKKWLPLKGKGREKKEGINIPSHFWSAFCCTNKKYITGRISRAYIAEQENFNVQNLTIDDLNKQLTELYGQDFSVFPGLKLRK
ncbi:hypothetical protein PHYPO_G00109980 [Pangasianodon hypophthalmus]|uniref:DNA/RNA non-specific endonuclease domain-containing protein n=1 Tax=Pangasianodon hypophthalmus TaxID=310915 RepID=A0A5N5PZK6_PANHP|nr:hypothetical protein PHYPO_G00109980 [Pangasianodon hypophthalmus]